MQPGVTGFQDIENVPLLRQEACLEQTSQAIDVQQLKEVIITPGMLQSTCRVVPQSLEAEAAETTSLMHGHAERSTMEQTAPYCSDSSQPTTMPFMRASSSGSSDSAWICRLVVLVT